MEARWLQLVTTTAIASSVEGPSRISFTHDLLEYVPANNLTLLSSLHCFSERI